MLILIAALLTVRGLVIKLLEHIILCNKTGDLFVRMAVFGCPITGLCYTDAFGNNKETNMQNFPKTFECKISDKFVIFTPRCTRRFHPGSQQTPYLSV